MEYFNELKLWLCNTITGDNFKELKLRLFSLLEFCDESTTKVVSALTLLVAMLFFEIYYKWYNNANIPSTLSNTNYFYSHCKMIKDSIFFELDEGLLLMPSSSPPLITPWRSVDNLDTIRWRLSLHPNVTGRFLEIEVQTETDNAEIQMNADIVFIKTLLQYHYENAGYLKVSHVEIKKKGAFREGKLVIRVDGKFIVPSQIATVMPSLPEAPARITLQDLGNYHGSFDAVLHVQNKNIDIHRKYFSMFSEVFRAMFEHGTREKECGIVTIKDFDYTTVKIAVDYLYGHGSERLNVKEVIGIYRFADKYCMESVITKMESWLLHNLTVINFCYVVGNTWSFASPALKTVYGRVFHSNLTQLALTDDFLRLPERVVVEILKEAAKYR